MKTFRANSSKGMTLIEVMIAMLIGVFLIGGVIQIFLSAKQAYRLQENLSRLQENGRFAMSFISKDVRMAGYTGCSSKATLNSILDPSVVNIPALTTAMVGVDGSVVTVSSWNSVAQPTACGTSPAECTPGTDVISIQTATSCGGQLTDDASNSAQLSIATPNSCGLGQDDIAIVSDCSKADVFSITNNPGDGSLVGNGKQNFAHGLGGRNCAPKLGDVNCVNNSSPNNFQYKKGESEIFSPQLVSYYIRTGAGGIPSLWRLNNAKAQSNGINPVELVEGIENMQVVYGVDTDDDNSVNRYIPNYYVDASKVPATLTTPNGTSVKGWERVVSVRIDLLAVTIDDSLTNVAQSYNYNGTTTTPTDRKLRRVFSSTIAIRNRMP